MVFTTTVSTLPVCTPYRASLLTGQYLLTHGLIYNNMPLADNALTIGEIYKQNGIDMPIDMPFSDVTCANPNRQIIV